MFPKFVFVLKDTFGDTAQVFEYHPDMEEGRLKGILCVCIRQNFKNYKNSLNISLHPQFMFSQRRDFLFLAERQTLAHHYCVYQSICPHDSIGVLSLNTKTDHCICRKKQKNKSCCAHYPKFIYKLC